MHILRFIALHGIYYVVNFILFSLENDDMESSKRCVKLLSLILIIRCLTKSNLIRILERRSLKKVRASTGFKPVTLRYRYNALPTEL